MSEDKVKYQTRNQPLSGKLTISRMHSNLNREDTIRIQVEDKTSGINFLEINLTPEALALALTGVAYQECTFELRGLQSVGKRRELKEEIVSAAMVRPDQMSKEEIRAWLARYESEGWMVNNDRDFGNHHRRQGDGYRVTFVRFTEVEEVGNA